MDVWFRDFGRLIGNVWFLDNLMLISDLGY